MNSKAVQNLLLNRTKTKIIETAERLLEARQRMLDGFPNVFKDHWHMQGEVSLHYINSLTKNAKRE